MFTSGVFAANSGSIILPRKTGFILDFVGSVESSVSSILMEIFGSVSIGR